MNETTTYTTRDGDTVDYVAWRFYGGTVPGATEQVLEANPGLAAYGPTLPAGLQLVLPAADQVQAQAADTKEVRLWD